MSFYHQNFNVLGKVDGSKTVVTPDHVYFKMREATFLEDPEYSRLKTHTTYSTYPVTTCPPPSLPPPPPPITPKPLTTYELELLEREKDRRFQMLFKELWPNIHSTLSDEKTTAQKLAAEIEKNKVMQDMLIEQELAKIKAKKEEELKAHPPLPSCYSSIYTPRCNDALNISINGLASSSCPKVEITMPKTTADFTYKPTPTPTSTCSCKHAWSYSISGYDLPSCTCKSHWSSATLEANKALIESKERQKEKEKLDKTSHLVDSLIESVQSLQTDLKRKSTELKLKEIEMMKKESEERARSKSPCCRRRRLSVSFRGDDCSSPPPSSRPILIKSSSTCSLHRTDSSESSSEYTDLEKKVRKARVKSILRTSAKRSPSSEKYHIHHHPPHHHHYVESSYIQPKVDCWNRNVVDYKIY